MKKSLTIYTKIVFASLIITSCNRLEKKIEETNKVQNTSNKIESKLNENSKSEIEKRLVIDTINQSKDSIAELLNLLQHTPTGVNYIVKGELKTDILKYKSMEFGDLLHLGFVDKNNKEYDFNGNTSKIELFKEAINPSEENGGYEANKKYLNKKFRVVWRTMKLKHKPKDEMEMYYEVYDEIIYLKAN